MESAENREQSPKASQQEEKSDSPSLSKIETIKLLNDSIDQLESAIRDISDNPAEDIPSSDSINTLLSTTQELASSVAPSPTPEVVIQEDSIEEKPAIPAAEVKPEKEQIPAAEIKTKPAKIPSPQKTPVKPKGKAIAKTKKKENRGLLIIGAVAIAIAVIAVIWSYLPQIKAAISPVPEPIEIVADREIQSNPEIDIPVVNPDENIDSDLEDDLLPDIQLTETEPETVEPTAIPQDLTSPGRAKNLKIESIEPELTFTPEQTLIAALQTKLAEITENYDSDLFKNIKVDLPETSLSIEVTDNWYELNESRQDTLANEILKRSRQLNFSKLQFQGFHRDISCS